MTSPEENTDLSDLLDAIRNNNTDMANDHLGNASSESRPPERIDTVLSELESYWKEHPDLRLGQIISNISNKNGFGDDPFYMEDDTVLNQLQHYNEE
jgi:hypothetical protein